MGYIGSDPKNNESVSTSQLVDDSVTNAKIVDNVLFTSVTSSIVSASGNITADTFTGTFNGALSSSAQIATSISGSSTSLSSSLSTRATTLESASGSFASDLVTLKGSGTAQGVGTSDSPTFADATITGTLTAQEVHTEFESASILFTSGSTQFGNSLDDNHVFSGSLLVTGSLVQLRGDSTKLRFSNDAGAERAFLQLNSTGLNIDTDSFIDFKPNNTFAARFDSNGRLGIGTNNPQSEAHISGSGEVQLYIDAQGGNNSGIRLLEAGANKWTIGNDQSNDSLFFYDFGASSTRFSINSSGNVHFTGVVASGASSAVGIATAQADANSGELGPGYLNLARDDTADAKQIQFTKNGSIHSSIETTNGYLKFYHGTDERLWIGNATDNWGLNFTGNSPYGLQITTTSDGSSSHDAFVIKRASNNKVFEIFNDGALTTYGTGAATFAGQVKLKEGAYNNLSLAFTDDTDTGLYLGGTNALGFVTNGTVALELQGTQLADFRGDLHVPEYIKHRGDTDTSIRFTDNTINFISGGSTTMQHINGGAIITHGATKASLTKGKSVGSGANVITFTVTVANTSSWEPINWLVEANYTTANLSAQGYYFGWGHTYHYSASGLAATSIGHGGASSNITVTCGNHSSNSFDITVTSSTTSGTINMIATLDIRARHGISNIVAA